MEALASLAVFGTSITDPSLRWIKLLLSSCGSSSGATTCAQLPEPLPLSSLLLLRDLSCGGSSLSADDGGGGGADGGGGGGGGSGAGGVGLAAIGLSLSLSLLGWPGRNVVTNQSPTENYTSLPKSHNAML